MTVDRSGQVATCGKSPDRGPAAQGPQRDSAALGILQRCEPVDLVFGANLCDPDRRLQHIYFPLTGTISPVAPAVGHPPMEMGPIGNEGMLGATVMLGVDAARLRGVVQGSGTALRLTALQIRQELRENISLHRTISRYLYVSLAQLSQSAACTSI